MDIFTKKNDFKSWKQSSLLSLHFTVNAKLGILNSIYAKLKITKKKHWIQNIQKTLFINKKTL